MPRIHLNTVLGP